MKSVLTHLISAMLLVLAAQPALATSVRAPGLLCAEEAKLVASAAFHPEVVGNSALLKNFRAEIVESSVKKMVERFTVAVSGAGEADYANWYYTVEIDTSAGRCDVFSVELGDVD